MKKFSSVTANTKAEKHLEHVNTYFLLVGNTVLVPLFVYVMKPGLLERGTFVQMHAAFDSLSEGIYIM